MSPDLPLVAAQGEIVARPGRQVVLGGPGTGKTRALVAWALHRSDGPGPAPVLLVPSRRAADRVRRAFEDRALTTRGDRVARTPQSLAWAVLREHALRTGARPPRLITASEGDEAIAELLAGDAYDGGGPAWPPQLDARLRGTRAFRDELREMSARLIEHGLSPEDLAALAVRHDRPQWQAAASVLQQLEQVASLQAGEAYDPASIVAAAADLVSDPRTGLAQWLAEQVGHLGVDDAQDLTSAAWSFVREISDVVGDLLIVGDPDGPTQTFRGAHAGLLTRAPDFFQDAAAPVHVTSLTQALPQKPGVQQVSRAVSRELHGVAVPSWSAAAWQPGPASPDEVSLLICRDLADEAAVLAGELRGRRHREHDPVPWSQMAVLVRSVAGADQLRRTLQGAGVPVRAPGVRAPLREEPVVSLLLTAMQIAAAPQDLDAAVLERLCVGPLGGSDPVRWRRLVQHARALARRTDDKAVSGADALERLCAELRAAIAAQDTAAGTDGGVAGLAPAVAAPVARILDLLTAGSRAVPEGVEEVLWQIWDRLNLAERWRRTAIRGGPEALGAHGDLDAVMALFDAAATWVDGHPHAPVSAFVAYMRARGVGDDRLGGDGPVEAVTITSPAGAVGERWRVVVVAGVQDGVWPNPRLRGSLLGLTDLIDLLRHPAGFVTSGGVARYADLRRQARREVVLDEVRLFGVAVSRATDELIVTAVDDATTRPSDLCTLVAGAAGPALRTTRSASPLRPGGVASLGPSATLVEVTASLRRAAVGHQDPALRDAAARLLARLARAGVRGADPVEWAWSTPEAAGPDGSEPIRQVAGIGVSPSAVERFLRCPLQWYLTSTGGDRPRQSAQGLGTLVHAVLEHVPDADLAGMREAVEHGWGDLELGDGWVSDHQRGRVEGMLTKLSTWVAAQRADGHLVLGAEVPFSYQVDDVTVRGTIDRVERTSDGGVRVIDLKTGKTVASAAEALDNPQLQLYQLAVELGALPDVHGHPAGGLLLYVGSTTRSAAERVQPAPDKTATEAVRLRVREVGAGMRDSSFVARPSEACDRCPVRSSCPTTPEGRRTPAPSLASGEFS